jgi:adenosylcobinamide kinase/adenosylcobinamide-phosphate guanylyltransferase
VPATRIRAIHLGHRNPPEPELGRRLAAWGADAPKDGETFTVGRTTMTTDPTTSAAPATDALGTVTAQRTLIIGGARSGKSMEAERLLSAHPSVTYLATAPPRPDDPEWADRVKRHRDRRPRTWRTVETQDLAGALRTAGPGEALLIDCLALWTTALLDDAGAWEPDIDLDAVHDRIDAAVDGVVAALERTSARVVLVTNEVGAGVVPTSASGRLFRDTLGRVNRRIAAACDEVLEVMAGRVRAW